MIAKPTFGIPASAVLVGFLVLLGVMFLYAIGIDALEGRNEFQFFADSATYHEAARGELTHIDGFAGAIAVTGNFLGPLVLLNLVDGNYYVVLAINALLLYVSVRSFAKSLNLSSLRVLVVLLFNPITISSVLAINKEIVSLLVLAFLVRGISTRSTLYLAAAIVISPLVRWQLTLFVCGAIVMLGHWNPIHRYRWLSLSALLVALSIMYIFLSDVLEPVQRNFESSAAEYEGSGTFVRLVDWQNQGLYWLIFPLKAAHLLFATGLRFDRLLNPVIIYNDIWQLLHSTATLIVFLILAFRRRFTLKNDLIYISAIYTALFALTPIYTPRYFYPVYILWSLVLLGANPKLRSSRSSRPARAHTSFETEVKVNAN